MDFFWNGEIKNLNKEMEAYNILFSGIDSVEVNESNYNVPMADTSRLS